MLSDELIERILGRLPSLTIGVLGDLFLDRYLDIDAALTEPSIETGLDAYQVVRVRSYPGAAGTVINNLAALGVGRIVPISVIGDDGEGYELRQALAKMKAVDATNVWAQRDRRTPTYTKPMLQKTGQPPRELNRLDIKNRTPRSMSGVSDALDICWYQLDALVVLDQVSEEDCGVVTTGVREVLAATGRDHPNKLILVDSRERIGEFRNVSLKPNREECLRAGSPEAWPFAVSALAHRAGRPVFCTAGDQGIFLADPRRAEPTPIQIPTYPVSDPIDTVGAGDSTSAGIACAVAAGTTLEQAAAFGNLAASITIQQIGTTGTASPEQIRQRWREVNRE